MSRRGGGILGGDKTKNFCGDVTLDRVRR